jgi:hypothetical protein
MSLPSFVTLLNVKRRALNFPGISPEAQRQLKTFFETLGQLKGNPDLAVVEFDELSDTDVVLADAAAKLYFVYLQKDTATASWSKITDHASTASDAASELRFKTARIGDECIAYPSGLALANGATAQGTTTADGGTGSASDGAKGFVIIGAA